MFFDAAWCSRGLFPLRLGVIVLVLVGMIVSITRSDSFQQCVLMKKLYCGGVDEDERVGECFVGE